MLEHADKADLQPENDLMDKIAKSLLEETAKEPGLRDTGRTGDKIDHHHHHHCPPGWIVVGNPYPHCQKNR